MSIAKKIAAKRGEQERQFVEVEEWGEEDKPLLLYYGPVTARDIEKVQRKYKDFLNNVSMGAMVEMIIYKCQTQDGENAFTLEDKPILMGEPISVITKIFAAVFNSQSVEDHEKN